MLGRKTITVIPISPTTQRISISNDDRLVFTADQTKPQLAVIDTSTNKVTHWVELPSKGYGTAPTRDGLFLLVALPSENKVGVVDLSTLKLARTLDVCGSPQEILARPDGQVAYVSCSASHQVAAINLSQWKVEAFIEAGNGADGLAWAGR
jgi:DNA-binding beta-propeller fold protein YncE